MNKIENLPKQVQDKLNTIGISREKNRAGSYMLLDNLMLIRSINAKYNGKLEILDTKEALKKYPWAKNYLWKIISKNKDEFTRKVANRFDGGYFIHIKKGAKLSLPVQSCLMIATNEYSQKIHNIIIVEKGADVKIIAGCTLHPDVSKSTHIGISEFFIEENAKLNFTMIHNWNKNTLVRPRSAALLGKNSEFISNYVLLHPVLDLQMYPAANCLGDNSKVSFNNLIFGTQNSLIDIGSKAELNGKNSKGEVISRTIAKDSSFVIARGQLIGNSPSKAHLECKGIIIGSNAKMHAIPELISNTESAELSHEAAVGKIAEKEVIYLMSRGLTEEEAVSMIVRGFMDVGIFGLPESLNNSIKNMMAIITKGI